MPLVLNRSNLDDIRWTDLSDADALITYPSVDWVHNPDTSAWNMGETNQVLPWHRKLIGDVPAEMTSGEKQTADNARLPTVKIKKNKSFTRRTAELRETGFEYPASSGTYWPLTKEMQTRLADAYNMRGEVSISVEIVSVDKTTTFLIDTEQKLIAVYKEMKAQNDAIDNSETILNKQVDAALTVAEVKAIVDPR